MEFLWAINEFSSSFNFSTSSQNFMLQSGNLFWVSEWFELRSSSESDIKLRMLMVWPNNKLLALREFYRI